MVDFCNACNLHCLCCYNYSPLSPCRFNREERLRAFPTDLFLSLVEDCARLGVPRISLAGYGEPLLHPDLTTILAALRQRKIKAFITTNGTLLRRHPELTDLLYGAVVSIQAGSPEAFRRMHPNDPTASWPRVLEGLRLLQQGGVPTSLAFVLCSENYQDLEAAIDLAGEYGASLAIQPIRPFVRKAEGQAEFDAEQKGLLRLTEAHLSELLARRDSLRRRAEQRGVSVYGLWDFLALAERGLTGDAETGTSERLGDLYQQQPCYVGWFFSRVLIDGTVTACCQCVGGISFGSIARQSFAEIWRSPQYRWFRTTALHAPLHETEIWKCCECTVCDSVTKNRRAHQILNGPTPAALALRLIHPLVRRRASGEAKKPILRTEPNLDF